MMNKPEYIGDGVYVDYDGWAVEVRVNDHRNPVAVTLEDKVALELVLYFLRVWPNMAPFLHGATKPPTT